MITIEDYLDKKGVERDSKHRRNEDSLMYYCPIHNERSASFHVTPSEQLWHCYGCKRGGGLKLLIFLAEGFDHFWKVYEYLGIPPLPKEDQKEEDTPPLKREKSRTYASPEVQTLFAYAARWWHSQLWRNSTQSGTARHYLLARGSALHVLHSPQIGYAPKESSRVFSQMLATDSGLANWRELAVAHGLLMPNGDARMQGRVMFSSCNTSGSYLYFQGRILPPWKSRYKYLGAAGCSKYPFSLPVVSPILKGTVGIESPVGAVVLASYAVNNIATLGNGTLTRELLLKHPTPYYWTQDNDEPRPITRNDTIIGYEQPGEIQAQACLEYCKAEGLPAFRLLPPPRYKGLDEWICASQSITPLLQALPQYYVERVEVCV